MTDPARSIVTLKDRPDLLPVVAGWLWEAFWQADGFTLSETEALFAAATASIGPPQTFVMLEGGVPFGTASLAAQDLDLRPDLTPWLAAVFVVPAARGRGIASQLVEAVVATAQRGGTSRLWLYTWSAERLYSTMGWARVESFYRAGHEHVLMRRDLSPAATSAAAG